MKRFVTALSSLMSLAGLAFFAGSCSLIDENLVDCPEDIIVDYHVRLITNKEQEMDLKLGTDKDLPLRQALEDYLRDIFVETARDANLSFYTRPADERALNATDVWNSNGRTYELQLQSGDYVNLVAANLEGNGVVSYVGDETSAGASFNQNAKDIVASHKTGLYTARSAMRILDRTEYQHFDVDLYMANDAGGIVLNVDSCYFSNIRCEIEGLADGFNILDSTYTYNAHTLVKTDLVDAQPYVDKLSKTGGPARTGLYTQHMWERWERTPVIMCGVGFSSRNMTEKFIDGMTVYWILHLYVTLESGSVTHSTIYVAEPLPAGNLKIIVGWLLGNGSFSPDPPTPGPGPLPPEPPIEEKVIAGVDVELDWNPGPEFNPSL
ncbi:MAG: hypothetical protein IKX60_00425 [Bacteroidales bacterium]|nr:hypothetical protein [Bacteroidales bacterium]